MKKKKKLFHFGMFEPYRPDLYAFEFILFSMPDEKYLKALAERKKK